MDDGVKINKRRLKSAVLLIMLALLLDSAGGCSKDTQQNGEIDVQELASGMQELIDSEKMRRSANPTRFLMIF